MSIQEVARIQATDVGAYLIIDPEICHGQLTFKGTRIPVETVLTSFIFLSVFKEYYANIYSVHRV